MRNSKIIIFLTFVATVDVLLFASSSPVYDLKNKKHLNPLQIQNAKIGCKDDDMGDEESLVRRIVRGYLEKINRDMTQGQTEQRLKAKELSNNMDFESQLSAVKKRMMPGRDFPELLNCKIIYFPWPNQHIFCCQKTDICHCPRPMGVCTKPEDEEKDNGEKIFIMP